MSRKHIVRNISGLLSVFLFTLALASQILVGQTTSKPASNQSPSITYVACGTLIDGKSQAPRKNAVIQIEGEKIKAVLGYSPDLANNRADGSAFIDIRPATCLPGLIDTHTHVLLQGDVTEAQYDEQLLKWSVPYRTILATQSARKALSYGFTTIRDLETEGAGYADVAIRDAISQGVIPGPRMKVATRAMDVTGAYPLLGYSPEVPVPHGVQLVDGPEEARKAVRDQISHGADWIKVYADRSYFFRKDGVPDDIPTFTPEELRAVVDEAHRERHKVAAHAARLRGVHNAVEAGVDSIEHGFYIADDDLRLMAQRGIVYVPTLYVGEYVAEGRAAEGHPVWIQMAKIHGDTFRKALNAGVKIAFGTDVGGFDWKTTPALEFPLMVKYGMTPAQAIRAATQTAAELLEMSDAVGSIEPGKLADVIAVPDDPLADVSALQHVNFVMKGGVVFKGWK